MSTMINRVALAICDCDAAGAISREPTETMEDAARGAWLWYSGLPHDNKWTLGQQNKAGGYKLSLTDAEAAATHLPKHVMGRICWRTQIDAALSPELSFRAPSTDEART